jgi:iron(III) transport system permease protein
MSTTAAPERSKATEQAPASLYKRILDRAERLPLFPALVAVVAIVMAFLVIYPLAKLLYNVFVAKDAFGSYSISATFTDPALPSALEHTAILIVVAGPISLLVGAIFAWLNERTDVRMEWAADTLPIIPLLVPQLATAIGWVMLLAPRAGLGNALYRWIFDRSDVLSGSGPGNIYGMVGLVWVTIIVTVPLSYLIVSAALRNIDPSLEEASFMSGVGPIRTLFKVTLPAIRNGLAAAATLIVILVISIFSVPIIVGGTVGIDTLSTLIYQMLYSSGGLPHVGEAVLLSIFMFVVIQVVVFVEYAVTRRGRHATISGRGRTASAKISLGVLRWPLRVLQLLYLLCATVFPVAGLLIVSLQGFWTADIKWSALNFSNYSEIFSGGNELGQAFKNSLELGLISATVLIIIAAILVFYIDSAGGLLARLANAVSALPAAVPHVVVGVGFLVALGTGSYGLGGTLLILFLAYLVVTLPQATRSAGAAMSQVGKELREASVMCGASQIRTFVRVVLPLMGAGLLAGWVIVFVGTFSEVSASVFLSGPGNPVTGPSIVSLWNNTGTFSQLAALALSVTVAQTLVVLVVRALTRVCGRRQGLRLRPREGTRRRPWQAAAVSPPPTEVVD